MSTMPASASRGMTETFAAARKCAADGCWHSAMTAVMNARTNLHQRAKRVIRPRASKDMARQGASWRVVWRKGVVPLKVRGGSKSLLKKVSGTLRRLIFAKLRCRLQSSRHLFQLAIQHRTRPVRESKGSIDAIHGLYVDVAHAWFSACGTTLTVETHFARPDLHNSRTRFLSVESVASSTHTGLHRTSRHALSAIANIHPDQAPQ